MEFNNCIKIKEYGVYCTSKSELKNLILIVRNILINTKQQLSPQFQQQICNFDFLFKRTLETKQNAKDYDVTKRLQVTFTLTSSKVGVTLEQRVSLIVT